jgi:hypothetical protein
MVLFLNVRGPRIRVRNVLQVLMLHRYARDCGVPWLLRLIVFLSSWVPGFRSRTESMWDLRWTKWHWGRFFSPDYFGIPLSVSFSVPRSFIRHRRCIVLACTASLNNSLREAATAADLTVVCINARNMIYDM